MAVLNTKLNSIQVHLLRFFNERNVSQQETQDLQKLIAQYYANKADKIMDEIWEEKGLDESKMYELLEQDLKK
jgi:hypothetical protein